MQAVATKRPPLEGQEAPGELFRLIGQWPQATVSLAERILPSGPWSATQTTVNTLVVLLANLNCEPALQFCHRQDRLGLGWVGSLVLRIRPGRTGEQMHTAHDRADQTLDVPAIVRRGHRAQDQLDAVFVATSTQGSAGEIRAIVGVQGAWQSPPGHRHAKARAFSQGSLGRTACVRHKATDVEEGASSET